MMLGGQAKQGRAFGVRDNRRGNVYKQRSVRRLRQAFHRLASEGVVTRPMAHPRALVEAPCRAQRWWRGPVCGRRGPESDTAPASAQAEHIWGIALVPHPHSLGPGTAPPLSLPSPGPGAPRQ